MPDTTPVRYFLVRVLDAIYMDSDRPDLVPGSSFVNAIELYLEEHGEPSKKTIADLKARYETPRTDFLNAIEIRLSQDRKP